MELKKETVWRLVKVKQSAVANLHPLLPPFLQPRHSAKAIDAYIEATSATGDTSPDPRLRTIVDQMFSRCIADKDYKQALGIALETSRLDVIEEVFNVTRDQGLLTYVLEAVMGVIHALTLRNQVSSL